MMLHVKIVTNNVLTTIKMERHLKMKKNKPIKRSNRHTKLKCLEHRKNILIKVMLIINQRKRQIILKRKQIEKKKAMLFAANKFSLKYLNNHKNHQPRRSHS